jgi:hypothetical protein
VPGSPAQSLWLTPACGLCLRGTKSVARLKSAIGLRHATASPMADLCYAESRHVNGTTPCDGLSKQLHKCGTVLLGCYLDCGIIASKSAFFPSVENATLLTAPTLKLEISIVISGSSDSCKNYFTRSLRPAALSKAAGLLLFRGAPLTAVGGKQHVPAAYAELQCACG